MIRTIARNRRARIDAIFAGATECMVHLADPWRRNVRYFRCHPGEALADLKGSRYAKLRDKGHGLYTVTVDNHIWYDVTSLVKEPTL